MAKNEKSSKELARLASDVLSGKWDAIPPKDGNSYYTYSQLLKIAYALAGSVLTQAPDKKKPAVKKKK